MKFIKKQNTRRSIMKHMELHILQSVPVSCLNRDDLGSPKTAIFGGVQRARVSSQSWKSAIRDMAKSESPELFKGERTRLIMDGLVTKLTQLNIPDDQARALAFCTVHYLVQVDSKDSKKSTTMIFMSDNELTRIAKKLLNLNEKYKDNLISLYNSFVLESQSHEEENKTNDNQQDSKTGKKVRKKKLTLKDLSKGVSSVLKPLFKDYNTEGLTADAADIALFGRMVANDAHLNIEGAAMFSHALSTHKVDNEIDFFTAVDDLQPDDVSGAGMMGTLEFNSATYYRFAALNLDLLKENLSVMKPEERQEVVKTFVKSTLMAMPMAKKNSMNGNTLPGFVLVVIREKCHPIQLVNAFEDPIWSKGVFKKSVNALNNEYETLKKTWDLDETLKLKMPENNLTTILEEVVKYVD